jgi:hypothetical protein
MNVRPPPVHYIPKEVLLTFNWQKRNKWYTEQCRKDMMPQAYFPYKVSEYKTYIEKITHLMFLRFSSRCVTNNDKRNKFPSAQLASVTPLI